jgi:ATP synthase subunit 6
MYSPLEQFNILPFLKFNFFSLLIFSNYTVMLGCILFFWLCWISLSSRCVGLFNTFFLFFNTIFLFLITLISENIFKKGFYFLPYLFFLFFFLLCCNLSGMIPYSFAITSHFIGTFFFSFLTFFSVILIGFQQHGINFLSLFVPNGAPFLLLPFLIIIEIISFFARLFSLAIRLFANIMSGHTLLKILAGFAWILCFQLQSLLFIIPLLIVFIITGLEIIIAFLQSYVFSILTSIYINEALVLH